MRRRGPGIALLSGAALLLAGCAETVPTTAAPNATDPVCASVVLATPDELSKLPKRQTNAQATTAWGEPSSAIVLRCGVKPLGPTTDRCTTVDNPNGASVDWVVTEGDPENPDVGEWTFTTYGRVPAVSVTVPESVRKAHSTSFLVDLGPAVAKTDKQRSCL